MTWKSIFRVAGSQRQVPGAVHHSSLDSLCLTRSLGGRFFCTVPVLQMWLSNNLGITAAVPNQNFLQHFQCAISLTPSACYRVGQGWQLYSCPNRSESRQGQALEVLGSRQTSMRLLDFSLVTLGKESVNFWGNLL